MSEALLPIATMAFGVLIVASMFVFGLRVYNHRLDDGIHFLIEHLIHRFESTNQKPTSDWKFFFEAWDDLLRRRNKFWELFGQVALSVVVTVIVAVLLLTETIRADAGLPILSAVVAFVIGKGIDGQGRGPTGTPTAPPDSDG